MPVQNVRVDKELVEQYYQTLLEPTQDGQTELLLTLRKQYIQEREANIAMTKNTSLGLDNETKRWFSKEAKRYLKLYRATCLWLGWYSYDTSLGDITYGVYCRAFSCDLSEELDAIHRKLILL